MRDEAMVQTKLDEFLKMKSSGEYRRDHEMRFMLNGAIDALRWVLDAEQKTRTQ
jgi:hypothetical protein